ncbi:carbon dioxide concentrating mechanism/carboxysome shell protein [Desulfosporosinus orientis DSM 765]|uniref:Carbon dioxide concentrating mechanism/carboxysome shell protein n=1 Tax=Desulfosporosinus orientis (strain ATCC 19365 / DSM 765 / NCIMB 8382 / VKM B-1628 / Singapore I) TaxID=768706 RepID=G7WB41_DESOD|nr:EutN/CcmL family microcompartment protein [Desulfosporosinus orientis]AET67542.1 carbon dioxide concentrating mechanism/carboxysome shell protein [Desulfosporosinus orientis DSM 765]
MILARVIGHVWSTRKEESLRGLKFLVVQPVTLSYLEDGTPKLEETGNSLIAADQIGAGEDEIVMVASGSSARQGLANNSVPIDATIVGIIDKETFEA